MVVSNICQLSRVRDALTRYSTFFDIMIGRPNKASKINRVRFKYCTWNVFAPQKLMYHLNKEDIGWRLNSIVLYLHQNPSVITIDLSSQSFSKSFLGNYQGWRGRFEKWSPCHVSFEQTKTPLKTCWSKLKIWLWRYYILSINSCITSFLAWI